MHIRFNVTAFVSPDTRVGVIGSIEELGLWDISKCVPLHPYNSSDSELDPSMWSRSIAIDALKYFNEEKPINYKFLTWKAKSKLPVLGEPQLQADNELEIPNPLLSEKDILMLTPPSTTDIIKWEGYSNSDNRQIIFSSKSNDMHNPQSFIHYISMNKVSQEYILPVPIFRDEGMGSFTELTYTSRSYLHHKKLEEMTYNRILSRVLVGSCPRRLKDILHLRDKEHVTDVMNFQTTQDILDTFIAEEHIEETNPKNLAELYQQHKLNYVWAPMEDMCTVSRSLQTSQNIATLILLLNRPDCTGVYIHCSAGIGRSICCVAGYIHLILKAPLYLTQLLIKMRRPVAHFDEYALKYVATDFVKKFSAVYKMSFSKIKA